MIYTAQISTKEGDHKEQIENLANMSNVDIALNFHRYYSSQKDEAFSLMEQLNKLSRIEEHEGKKYKSAWRVGIRITDRIVFDIDGHDENNLKEIIINYKKLYNSNFFIIKTLHGYHILTKRTFSDKDYWLYEVCRQLYPLLNRKELGSYIQSIENYDDSRREITQDGIITRKKLIDGKDKFVSDFKSSGLYMGIGNFDIIHTLNAIRRGRYVLRISKKSKNDNYEEIDLNTL